MGTKRSGGGSFRSQRMNGATKPPHRLPPDFALIQLCKEPPEHRHGAFLGGGGPSGSHCSTPNSMEFQEFGVHPEMMCHTFTPFSELNEEQIMDGGVHNNWSMLHNLDRRDAQLSITDSLEQQRQETSVDDNRWQLQPLSMPSPRHAGGRLQRMVSFIGAPDNSSSFITAGFSAPSSILRSCSLRCIRGRNMDTNDTSSWGGSSTPLSAKGSHDVLLSSRGADDEAVEFSLREEPDKSTRQAFSKQAVTEAASQKRIHTLVVKEQTLSAQHAATELPLLQTDGCTITVGGSDDLTFVADEVVSYRRGSTSLESRKLTQVKDMFVSGYCAAVLCSEGSAPGNRSPFLVSSLWLLLRKLVGDIIASVKREREFARIKLMCAFAAVQGDKIADLLKEGMKFETLCVRPSPLFGMRLVGLEYRNITDAAAFNSIFTESATKFSETANVESTYLVLSLLLHKSMMATKEEEEEEEEGDALASSLLIVIAGESVGNLKHVVETIESKPHPLFDDCIRGACHTLSMYVTHAWDKRAAEAIRLQKDLMEVKHEAPRFGSAKALVKTVDEAIERAAILLAGTSNANERKKIQKHIENRLTFKKFLYDLLEETRRQT